MHKLYDWNLDSIFVDFQSCLEVKEKNHYLIK